MHTYSSDEAERTAGGERTPGGETGFVPTIESGEIFRQLIKDELRNGRLTPARRRRIIRYAAKLRMSAVEAGQLITRCREQALESRDPAERFHALRLVEAKPSKIPIPLKIAIVVALAILADLLIFR